MKFCPECGTKLVSQRFCAECGADLRKYFEDTNNGSSLGNFDFSALESEAKRQLIEQSGLEMQGSVLVKYTGKSREVVIPKGVTEIFDGAFKNNDIVATVVIPESVNIIGKSAFEGCKYLKTVTMPSTIEEIYDSAFAYCGELETIIIPEKIKQIRHQVFCGCGSLKCITLPDSVTQIQHNAFQGCYRLSDIYITNLSAWCAISGLHELMNPERTNRLHLNNTPITKLVIPESITAIGDHAFSGCSDLVSVSFSKSLQSIGMCAFFASGLQEITIPPSVTRFGKKAFGSCKTLQRVTTFANIAGVNSTDTVFASCPNISRVTVANGATSIGDYAFCGCDKLTQIEIAKSVVSIGCDAFSGCTSLTGIHIPQSVLTIGFNAFRNCTGLTDVTIPNSVTSIGGAAFQGCNNLVEISLPFVGESRTATGLSGVLGYIFGHTTSRPNDTFVVEQYQEARDVWGQIHTNHYYCYIPEPLRRVTITDTTVIGNYAFNNCHQLTSIIIPNNVTTIGNAAFYNCRGLSGITLPHTVTSIGDSAFFWCTGLADISIPESVTSIGASAFCGCSNLTIINIPAAVENIGAHAFGRTFGINQSIKQTAFRVSERNAHFKSMDGVLYSKDGKQLIQYPCSKTDTRFTIPSTVTSVGDGAFSYCSYLTSLVIPNSVAYIGKGALEFCRNLTSLSLPFVGTINPNANSNAHFGIIFGGCNDACGVPSSLKSVTITGNTHIPSSAFAACRNLQSIILNYGVISIGEYAFHGCIAVTKIDIPSSVTSIGYEAFCDCESLAELSIPASVTNIARDLFACCKSITVRTSSSIAGKISRSGSASIRFIT